MLCLDITIKASSKESLLDACHPEQSFVFNINSWLPPALFPPFQPLHKASPSPISATFPITTQTIVFTHLSHPKHHQQARNLSIPFRPPTMQLLIPIATVLGLLASSAMAAPKPAANICVGLGVCKSNQECCSGDCVLDGGYGYCAKVGSHCTGTIFSCYKNEDCCSGKCDGVWPGVSGLVGLCQ